MGYGNRNDPATDSSKSILFVIKFTSIKIVELQIQLKFAVLKGFRTCCFGSFHTSLSYFTERMSGCYVQASDKLRIICNTFAFNLKM